MRFNIFATSWILASTISALPTIPEAYNAPQSQYYGVGETREYFYVGGRYVNATFV